MEDVQEELELEAEPTEPDEPAATEPEATPASSLPSPPPLRPAGQGTGRPLIPTRSREDLDEGWGGGHGGSNRDDEIKRERPPHW